MADYSKIRGEIIIFEHPYFRGHHRHIINQEHALNHKNDKSLDDKISSFIVVSGNWEFFRNPRGGDHLHGTSGSYGPGAYPDVGDLGIPHDQISSLKAIEQKQW